MSWFYSHWTFHGSVWLPIFVYIFNPFPLPTTRLTKSPKASQSIPSRSQQTVFQDSRHHDSILQPCTSAPYRVLQSVSLVFCLGVLHLATRARMTQFIKTHHSACENPSLTQCLQVFCLLVFEMGVFLALIVPLPFVVKRKLFAFISESPVVAKLQYGLKVSFSDSLPNVNSLC